MYIYIKSDEEKILALLNENESNQVESPNFNKPRIYFLP